MDRLTPFKIPDSKDPAAYILFLRGPSVPNGIKAYIYRDLRQYTKARCRVKAKEDPKIKGRMLATLSPSTKSILMDTLTKIAKQHDYDFNSILKEALRQNGQMAEAMKIPNRRY